MKSYNQFGKHFFYSVHQLLIILLFEILSYKFYYLYIYVMSEHMLNHLYTNNVKRNPAP